MYRKDINCLRGFSVVFIILYHFHPQLFYGGFIGVDILFCISGYVIGNTIYNKSLLTYYANRIKRISPSHVIVITVVLIAYKKSDPFDYQELFIQCRNSILFNLNNYYQWKNLDYLSVENDKFKSPVLHLWTLSIEFQFYIVSPVLIYLLNKNLLVDILIMVYLLYYSLFYTFTNLINSYFSSRIRLLDFIVGIFTIRKSKLNRKKEELLLFLVIIMLLFLNFYLKYYPGIIIVIPLLFSSLFIANPSSNRLINISFFNFIGNISYSLYLVHYPFLFYKSVFQSILYSVLLSLLLNNIVEKRFRYTKANSFIIISLYFIVIAITFILEKNLTRKKFQLTNKPKVNSVWNYNNQLVKKCFIKEKNKYKNEIGNYILLLGDSHMQHWYPAVNYFLKKENLAALSIIFWGNRIINNDYTILEKVFILFNSPSMILI